jgi:hypothetical protein
MELNFNSFEITADAYYERAAMILGQVDRTQNPALLFYAALEFRFCIERLLFEYIVLLSKTKMSKSVEKLYRAKNLKKQIMDFNELFFSIQSNKIILRRWQNLRDLLASTEDFLINIDKKVSSSF